MRTKSKRSAATAALRGSSRQFKNSVALPVRRVAQAVRSLAAPQSRQKTAWSVEPLEPRVLLSGDAIPGVHVIEGTVGQPGEQDRYEFVVNERSRFLFDGVQGDQMLWQLSGPNLTDKFDFRNLTANGDRFLDLDPGTYTLTVDAVGHGVGAYKFRLLGVEAAQPITSGVPVTGTLQPGSQAALYSINVEAGERLYFQSDNASATGSWSLFDPTASLVIGPSALNADGASVYVAQRAGTYWLSVEGQAGASTTVNYGFRMFKSSGNAQLLSLGQDYVADLSVPGSRLAYSFDLNRTTQLAWDQLSGPNSSIQWSIVNMDTGITVSTAALSAQDGAGAPLRLTPGHYQLVLASSGRTPNPVRFRLLDAGQASPLAAGDLLPTDAGRALGGSVRRIDVGQASTLSLAHLASADAGAVKNTIANSRDWLASDGTPELTDVTLGGGLTGVNDVQMLRVFAAAGDQLRFAVESSDIAQRLRLFNAAGLELASTTGSTLDWTAASTGLLYLGVSHAANGSYNPTLVPTDGSPAPGHLRLSQTRTLAKPAAAGDIADVIADAQDVLIAKGASRPVNITIGDGATGTRDVDMYRVVLEAGETFRLTTPNGSFDGFARIFDANGTALSATNDTPLAYVVATTGVYYVGFSGNPNTGYSANTGGSGSAGATGVMQVTFTREPGTSTPPAEQWVVTDRQGILVGSGSLDQGSVASVDLNSAGSYYLWTNPALGNGSRRGDLRVGLWSTTSVVPVALNLSASTEFSGNLAQSGQPLTFALTFPSAGAWMLEPTQVPAGTQWRLVGPYGTGPWTDATTNPASTSPLFFGAATYRLEVLTQSTALGTVAFRAVGLESALELNSAEPCALPDLAVGGTALYKLASAPKDAFAGAFSAAAADFLVRAYDAYGQNLPLDGSGGFAQRGATGPVYVRLVRIARSTDAALTYTLTRTPAVPPVVAPAMSITLGTEVNDSNAGVSTPTYSFTMETEGWVALEWQEGNWTTWRLTGPRGVVANEAIRESISGGSWNVPVRWVPPGTYTLQLSGGTGKARFTVRTGATAASITTNSLVTRNLDSLDAYELFDIELSAANNNYLRRATLTDSGFYYRLYDAGGALKNQGTLSSFTPILLSVPRDGHYLLALARNAQGSMSGPSVRFDVATTPAAPMPLPAGGLISGSFIRAYDSIAYTFSLQESSHLVLDQKAGNSGVYRLQNAAGVEVQPLSQSGIPSWGLEAGRYKLIVNGPPYFADPSSVYSFRTQVSVRNDSRVLGFTDPTPLTLSGGTADAVLQADLEAGLSYLMMPAAPLVSGASLRIRVFDPNGDLVSTVAEGQRFTPTISGGYRFMIGGSNGGAGLTGTYGLKLVKGALTTTPLAMGSDIVDSLSRTLDESRYRFTVADATRFALSVSGEGVQARLVRVDTGATVLTSANLSTTRLMQLQELLPGTYEWRFQSLKDGAAAYRLRMDDVSALQQLSLSTPAVASVPRSHWANAWAYDGTQGERLTLDPRVPSGGKGYWQLIGPNGSTVVSGTQTGMTDAMQRLVLPETGRYVLFLYGDVNDANARQSSFLVRRYAEPVIPMEIGKKVNGTIAQPGDMPQYSFTLDRDTTVVLSASGSAVGLEVWGDAGYAGGVNLRYFPEDLSSMRLRAGRYMVKASADISVTASFAFQLLDVEKVAVAHGAAPDFDVELPPGKQLSVHAFDVTDGERYSLSLAGVSPALGRVDYWLVSADGERLGSGNSSGSAMTWASRRTGRVYLLLQPMTPSAESSSAQVRVRQAVVASKVLEWDTPLTETLNTSLDRIEYTFTLDSPCLVDFSCTSMVGGVAYLDVTTEAGLSTTEDAAPGGFGPQFLKAGRYKVVMAGGNSGNAVQVTFNVSKAPVDRQLNRLAGQARTLTASAGVATKQVWTLEAVAGDTLALSASQWPGSGDVRILLPGGPSRPPAWVTWTPASAPTFTTKALRYGGVYMIVVNRPPQTEVADNSFTLQATVAGGTVAAPLPSTTSAEGSVYSDDVRRYGFTVTEPGLWYLDSGYGADRWDDSRPFDTSVTLLDDRGAVVSESWQQPIYLKAGNYTLNIINGSFKFTWRRVDSITSMTLGKTVTQPAGWSCLAYFYRFDAKAGDDLLFNLTGADTDAMRMSLYNGYGQLLKKWGGESQSPSDGWLASQDGPLYLVVDWTINTREIAYNAHSVTVSKRVPPASSALVLGQTVSDSLDASTQTRNYTFTLGEASTLQFDRLNAGVGDGLTLSLEGPTGPILLGEPLASGTNAPTTRTLNLVAGAYTLSVRNFTGLSASYAFRLLDQAASTLLSNGQVVPGKLLPSGEMQAYSIDVAAGDRLFVDFRTLTAQQSIYDSTLKKNRPNYTAGMRIIDPYGRDLSNKDIADTELVASVGGRYTLLLDNYLVYNVAVDYELAVYVNKPGAPKVIDVNVVNSMDLQVRDVAVRAAGAGESVRSGGLVTVSWTTFNKGSQATKGDFVDRVSIRRAGTGELIAQVTVPYVESAPGNGALLPLQQLPRQADLRLPDGPDGVGEFVVTVETDAMNSQIESGSAEFNNRAKANFSSELANYANLVAESLGITPGDGWSAGQAVRVEWATRNTGNKAATGSWSERIELVNQTTGIVVASLTQVVVDQHIDAGISAARSISFNWPNGLNAIGVFRLSVTVDTLSEVSEFGAGGALEADNTQTRTLSVGPDLVVRNVGLVRSDLQSGDEVTLLWDDVNEGGVATPSAYQDRVVVRRRNGDGSAGPVLVDTLVSFAGDAAAPLMAGEARRRLLKFTLPDGVQGSGTYDVTITADSSVSTTGILFEVNAGGTAETNNSADSNFNVALRPYADLKPISLQVPAAVDSGALTRVEWTVQNQGPVAA